MFLLETEISMSKVSGKKVKLKFSNKYFFRSSTSVAQKQLKPFTSFRLSQTDDLKESEIPMMVVWMLVFSTFSTNSLAFPIELSSTSVSIMKRFSAVFDFTISFVIKNSFKFSLAACSPVIKVVPPPGWIFQMRAVIASIQILAFFWTGITTSALLLKVTRPKESLDLNFEKNIKMASLASCILFPTPLKLRFPPIDPEISRIITEFRILSSRSYPSLLPLVKTVKQSLTSESNKLSSFWALEQPRNNSIGFLALGPMEYFNSLKHPSQVMWVSEGSDRS